MWIIIVGLAKRKTGYLNMKTLCKQMHKYFKISARWIGEGERLIKIDSEIFTCVNG